MASMTGAQPIEYYYPAGFGELNIELWTWSIVFTLQPNSTPH